MQVVSEENNWHAKKRTGRVGLPPDDGLNIPGESEMYTISGLDTEQTPATIEFKVVAEDYTATDITTNEKCTPYLIAAYNSCLEIKAGRVVSLIP